MEPWDRLLAWIERDGAAALVTVAGVEGSTPREAGARMAVAHDGSISGSIGGGPLEWAAIERARQMIASGRGSEWNSLALGPALDQCCGGRAQLLLESFGPDDAGWIAPLAAYAAPRLFTHAERDAGGVFRRRAADPNATDAALVRTGSGDLIERFGEPPTPLLLFGAGHVGRALVAALDPLPFAIRWIDDRADAFAGLEPGRGGNVVSALPESELRGAPAGAFVLVMTHSHALDLSIVAAALPDPRFPYVGLIGSATKRALFERRLAEFAVPGAAIARLVCPIGVRGVSGKSPPEIAAAVTAELLIERERAMKSVQSATELALG